ncbi:lymphocyte activation gene 3 protein-like [Seriola aureovittata]|uniref:lymphocyte activation gene 3 protein-like n=1 Tax=Seriola aureovittata TaxID=2871759 RepID=UPI0024BE7C42|nr:lymphocyte activation gene 3 protein-like [Seriola aureovittata]
MMLMECFILGMLTFLMTGVRCEVTEVFAEAGSQAILPCKCRRTSSTEPAIVWSKVNKGTVWRKQKNGLQYRGSSWLQQGIKRVDCPHSQFERRDYSLQIKKVREDDGGFYSCSIEFEDQVVKNIVMLRVITVSFSPPVLISRSYVSITCGVTPWLNEASVQWMLNNSPFIPQTGITLNRDSSKSVVSGKVKEGLTGNWTCVVSYKGKEGRASAALSVKGIIQPSNDNTKVYAAVGSAVTLPCVFSPDLNPSIPTWEKLQPGSLLKAVPGHLRPSFSPYSRSPKLPSDMSVSVKEVEFKDKGKYRCSATVQGQKLTRDIQLVVAKIDSSVLSKKKDSVTLTCQLSDTSEVTDYEWVHVTYDINGTQSVESIQKGKTLSISQVSEENWGEWVCRFTSKDGILGNVTYHAQLMSGLKGQKSSTFSQNTGAVVGLSVLLLVLLLILAQMYKNHRRRRRIFQYPALETIVHTISNEREERERSRVKM